MLGQIICIEKLQNKVNVVYMKKFVGYILEGL